LREIRCKYGETKSVDSAHRMLQEKFLSFLKHGLKLDKTTIEFILDKGMGLAGHKYGDTIIATKIPKSGYISEYFKEKDPVRRRAIYCHCPRIRDALNRDTDISPTYCYCGAGYYKGIWEEILQRPVKVELLESVLNGDDACKIAIHLSP
jgi:predicted hydrocarbon binding protein